MRNGSEACHPFDVCPTAAASARRLREVGGGCGVEYLQASSVGEACVEDVKMCFRG